MYLESLSSSYHPLSCVWTTPLQNNSFIHWLFACHFWYFLLWKALFWIRVINTILSIIQVQASAQAVREAWNCPPDIHSQHQMSPSNNSNSRPLPNRIGSDWVIKLIILTAQYLFMLCTLYNVKRQTKTLAHKSCKCITFIIVFY